MEMANLVTRTMFSAHESDADLGKAPAQSKNLKVINLSNAHVCKICLSPWEKKHPGLQNHFCGWSCVEGLMAHLPYMSTLFFIRFMLFFFQFTVWRTTVSVCQLDSPVSTWTPKTKLTVCTEEGTRTENNSLSVGALLQFSNRLFVVATEMSPERLDWTDNKHTHTQHSSAELTPHRQLCLNWVWTLRWHAHTFYTSHITTVNCINSLVKQQTRQTFTR